MLYKTLTLKRKHRQSKLEFPKITWIFPEEIGIVLGTIIGRNW